MERRTMAMPRINGVLETCLYSSDLPRAARFYREVLGLNLVEAGERLCVFSIARDQLLLIFQRCDNPQPIPTPGGVIPPHQAAGQLHIAFAIGKDDLAMWEERLAANGVRMESRVCWPAGGHSLFFRDTDDHLIELATPGLWPVY